MFKHEAWCLPFSLIVSPGVFALFTLSVAHEHPGIEKPSVMGGTLGAKRSKRPLAEEDSPN